MDTTFQDRALSLVSKPAVPVTMDSEGVYPPTMQNNYLILEVHDGVKRFDAHHEVSQFNELLAQ